MIQGMRRMVDIHLEDTETTSQKMMGRLLLKQFEVYLDFDSANLAAVNSFDLPLGTVSEVHCSFRTIFPM